MYKTILVVKDPKTIRIFKKTISEYFPQFEIVGIAANIDAALVLINKTVPGLVIFEWGTPGLKSIEFLEKTATINFEKIIISSNEKYIFPAFKQNALDYLLKPEKENDCFQALRKALETITNKNIKNEWVAFMTNLKSFKNGNSNKIAIPTVEGFVFINFDDIIRCEANGAYTNIYTSRKEKITASRNIKEYENQLPRPHFFRIHNSHLINVNRILKYKKGRGGTVIMEDGSQIEVASRRRSDFLDIFN